MSTDSTPVSFVDSITYHAWSADQSLVALACNTNDIYIYATNNYVNDPTKWTRKYTLDEHSGYISSLDWSHTTNHIVTCGHDRNAYVWKYDSKQDKWIPTLVILRINRAATCVRWSHDGQKFAVGSGSKQLAICYYESTNDWWISKMIKKFKSTVLSVAWSPCNTLIVTGSSDNKCRVFNVPMEKSSSIPSSMPYCSTFSTSGQFGELLHEFDGGAWVNAVDWSPDGSTLAFATHASQIQFIDVSSSDAVSKPASPIATPSLPYTSIAFMSGTQLIAAGYDMNIDLYNVDSSKQWSFVRKIDTSGQSVLTPVKQVATSAFSTARGLFGDVVQKGAQFGNKIEDTAIQTKHKNNIVNICLITQPTSTAAATKFTTASLDGRLCAWDMASLGNKVAGTVTAAMNAVKI